ncbi:hypothetical protein Avbf_06225 [Armadillidium vulgare]|nr:hypothetical protein Avbf_06225 [Armadillidium vulgare]
MSNEIHHTWNHIHYMVITVYSKTYLSLHLCSNALLMLNSLIETKDYVYYLNVIHVTFLFSFSKQINKMLIHQPVRTIPTFLNCFQRTNLFKSLPLYNFFGATSLQIHTSSPRFLKEIVATEENNVITIEGKFVESPRQGQLVKNPIEDKKV